MQAHTDNPIRDSVSNEEYFQLLAGNSPEEDNQACGNRRRSISESGRSAHGLYDVWTDGTQIPGRARNQDISQSNRRSSLALFTYSRQSITNQVSLPTSPPRATINPTQPTAEEISHTIQYGILNLLRTAPESSPQRSSEVARIVRINMCNIYLKFIIQALLYVLAALLLLTLVTWCCKMPTLVLIPLAILAPLHMAARMMHQPDNRLHIEHAHQAHSLFQGQNWAEKLHTIIDSTADYTVGFFSEFTRPLANTSLLDQQIQHIPDNSLTMV